MLSLHFVARFVENDRHQPFRLLLSDLVHLAVDLLVLDRFGVHDPGDHFALGVVLPVLVARFGSHCDAVDRGLQTFLVGGLAGPGRADHHDSVPHLQRVVQLFNLLEKLLAAIPIVVLQHPSDRLFQPA